MVTIANLPPQTEAEIQVLIAAGGDDDATEIVVAAVHQFAQREQSLADRRAKIQIGLDQAASGELIDDSPAFRRQLREDAHRLAIAGLPLDPDVCGQVRSSLQSTCPTGLPPPPCPLGAGMGYHAGKHR